MASLMPLILILKSHDQYSQIRKHHLRDTALVFMGMGIQTEKGDNILLTAFGGGFTWGTTYLKWAY